MTPNTPIDVIILRALFARPGEYVSGSDLADRLKLSRSAIWKHLEQLQRVGYPIEAQPHYGYRLLELPDIWCADEISARLGDPRPGSIHWRPVLFQETASTNDIAFREGQSGHPEGLIVLAEHQTQGRGRRGRSWDSQKSGGIYCSLLLRPGWPLHQASRLTILSSVAIARGIERLTAQKIEIKWPNDIFLNGRKLGGILTEIQSDPEAVRFAVIGFGLNLHQKRKDFPAALRDIATSLFQETDTHYRRADLLLSILDQFELCWKTPFEKVREEWTERCLNLGKNVVLSTPRGRCQGQAVGLDENGALLIRVESGRVETVTSGDLEY